MLVSYQWVKEYFPNLAVSAEELGERITRGGIEIEGVEHLNAEISNVVVGEVITCEKHPNADTLNKCTVNVGESEPVQIICGAPNVAAGQKVIVARVGAKLPGGMKIKRAKLRGEVSEGMICSLQELGFEGKTIPKAVADGIFVLPAEVEVGADATALLGLDDAILDMAITPNRADALSMTGVAYEVGAIVDQKPVFDAIPEVDTQGDVSEYVQVSVQDADTTPFYGMHVIKDVVVGESPLWLQTKLMKAGIRPHNNVVDVTNYICLKYGQPLHAFDYARLGSKEIVVRLASDGEEIVTLDGETRALNAGHAVITNGTNPIAIAGVMGGETSEVIETTTTVALEGAIFSSSYVGRASRELNLRTEASIRYDKGSDAWKVEKALQHGAALIAELAGGTLVGGLAAVDNRAKTDNVIETTLTRINRVLGTEISPTEVQAIFAKLQFELAIDGDTLTITVPSRRWDILIEADIFEEVARIYGYDKIPSTLPNSVSAGHLTVEQAAKRTIRRYLEGAGLNQALTYSLTTEQAATKLALSEEKAVSLSMPMSEEHSHLRTSIVPQLLKAASYNVARKNSNVALYELGTVFYATEGDNLPLETEHLAGLITGSWRETDWQKQEKKVDFFLLKGMVEGVVAKLGLEAALEWTQTEKQDLHPGRTASISLAGEELGYLAQIHPSLAAELDLKETYVFELDAAKLLAAPKKAVAYHTIPRFPSMTRDIALLVNKEVSQAALENEIKAQAGKLLTNIQLFDIFEGEKLGADKKSMAYTLTFLDPERTLTDEEVTKANQAIVTALETKFDAVVR
ncbi:phenylalanine--tRNA ligase subunit beta [Listeria newyorkensis]|uniref:Phenylalanine--tRNA ligase beta subunit n=1 Tax=Listeria newyorkensis TaxID=1497681 RepID=A0ABX4XI31_9LIST|nr:MULTISPECIES: phenylalanine--tRNA ligase subunit beta [Listeria]KGL45002.1 phenylalanyl-tRNA synthase subunit beta [Listeriaceae bacterium FSL A5-0209]KGL40872.1 phenylalanyl-tRNA synthase subunit beta [Listeria newyorkensis]PNP87087.1 phenylalanine--tRNA ligase subunit beta [Listeria newyorkensis]RQW68295.1 phenylalanine--tRNA ligase subunit beta [Listeria sp. SHR_NRA_18]WAO21313.1 phenylalanine--tRNA ligase subunit beta [Listeria newyorkensis]